MAQRRTVGDVKLGARPGRGLGDPQVAVLLLARLKEQDAGAALEVRHLPRDQKQDSEARARLSICLVAHPRLVSTSRAGSAIPRGIQPTHLQFSAVC